MGNIDWVQFLTDPLTLASALACVARVFSFWAKPVRSAAKSQSSNGPRTKPGMKAS